MAEMRPYIPYARQCIDEADIEAVVEVLRSAWLTTGPQGGIFESALADFAGARYGVAFASGTAALHAAMAALQIGPEDEVIVPAMTFVASANCVVFQGATPVFADVVEENLLVDPDSVERRITSRTKAILAVDYAGHPCDYGLLRRIADQHQLALVADACHSLGAKYKTARVGTLADLTVFSFHPVKAITTGEGGAVVTDDPRLARRLKSFRNHGLNADHHTRSSRGTWKYEMEQLGYNYRLSDIQAALGTSQLKKLPGWIEQRQQVAAEYNRGFGAIPAVRPLWVRSDVEHAYHLYVIALQTPNAAACRHDLFVGLRDVGIGVNVHYLPVHLHPYYRTRFRTGPGLCPVAEREYDKILSLPMYPQLRREQIHSVVAAVRELVGNGTVEGEML